MKINISELIIHSVNKNIRNIMINFDCLEYDSESDRLLIVVFDNGKLPRKIPIFRLSNIYTKDNCIIIEDDQKLIFCLEASGREDALEKFQELNALIYKYKNCKSNFMS